MIVRPPQDEPPEEQSKAPKGSPPPEFAFLEELSKGLNQMLAGIFFLLLCGARIGLSAEQPAALMPPLAEASPISIAEGPILLHANATGEWGGHTFSYLTMGEKFLFWA